MVTDGFGMQAGRSYRKLPHNQVHIPTMGMEKTLQFNQLVVFYS